MITSQDRSPAEEPPVKEPPIEEPKKNDPPADEPPVKEPPSKDEDRSSMNSSEQRTEYAGQGVTNQMYCSAIRLTGNTERLNALSLGTRMTWYSDEQLFVPVRLITNCLLLERLVIGPTYDCQPLACIVSARNVVTSNIVFQIPIDVLTDSSEVAFTKNVFIRHAAPNIQSFGCDISPM